MTVNVLGLPTFLFLAFMVALNEIMKNYLLAIIIFGIFNCEDKSTLPNYNTSHKFELHSNNRVASLLMDMNEYEIGLIMMDFSNILRTSLARYL